jgi:hypothetical protein
MAETISREVVVEARRALVGMRKILAASATRLAAEANDRLKLLRSPEVQDVARRTPELERRLSRVNKQAKSDLEEAKSLKAFQEQDLLQLDRDLEELGNRLS